MNWLNAIRRAANSVTSDTLIELTIQPHTGLDLLDPAYSPPQIILIAARDAQGEVSATPDPTPSPLPLPERMRVTATLNVRSTPDLSHYAINELRAGQIVTVTGSTKANGYTWAALLTIDGVRASGYVAREFLVSA